MDADKKCLVFRLGEARQNKLITKSLTETKAKKHFLSAGTDSPASKNSPFFALGVALVGLGLFFEGRPSLIIVLWHFNLGFSIFFEENTDSLFFLFGFAQK